MTVLITLTTAGTDSGPFDLYSNSTGSWVKFEDNVSKSALLAGYTSTLVPDGTTSVRVQSDGVCVNHIDIVVITTTTTSTSTSTTTSTTTLAPSMSIGSPTCRSGNCNDNASCGVHLPVNVYNAPPGYYVTFTLESSQDATASYSMGDGYITYTEENAVSGTGVIVTLRLYNSSGTLLAIVLNQSISHQSYWSLLTPCT